MEIKFKAVFNKATKKWERIWVKDGVESKPTKKRELEPTTKTEESKKN
jgi:hypothetical protein